MKQPVSHLISSVGHELSILVADAAAHPLSQAGVVTFCLMVGDRPSERYPYGYTLDCCDHANANGP